MKRAPSFLCFTAAIRTRKGGAFTLLELLVAMAVLALLLVVLASLVNSAASVAGAGNKRMDTDSQARLLLDRMALDFSKIVKRSDVDYDFQKKTGNDQMAFYSEATGYYPNGVTGTTLQSGISLVGYRVNSDNQLERLGRSLVWNGVTSSTSGASGVSGIDLKAMAYLPATLSGRWPGIDDGSDANYQVIADSVYRLEFNFLLKSFTDSSGVLQPSVLSLTPWDTRQGHTTANGLADVSAVVVTLGLLDNTSRKLVPSADYAGMITALPDASGSTPILKTWSDSNYLSGSGIPKTAAAQLRIYQRYFYLDSSL